jgi:hypothetical protein
MKVVILYRPVSEHARAVETFLRDFQMRNSAVSVETVDVDSRDGIAMIEVYQIVDYPAIIAMSDDGTVMNMWQGSSLPLMDEVASYAYHS